MRFQTLDWDSEFFGFPIARIMDSRLGAEGLANILSELTLRRFRLAYWFAERTPEPALLNRFRGLLVDRRVTFVVALDSRQFTRSPVGDVEPYSYRDSLLDLIDLAVQGGKHSRFALDPSFPRKTFLRLYRAWMVRSVQKEIASEVLLIRDLGRVAGMVTLGDKDGRGDIGLMAVGQPYRGRGYGESLVRSAQIWFVENGYKHGQVVTQERNRPACKLYRKCGYQVERLEYVYHFWL